MTSQTMPSLSFVYFVTARHVAKSFSNRESAFIVNAKTGGVKEVMAGDKWYLHPTDDSVDVAVLPCKHDKTLDINYISVNDLFLNPGRIKALDIGIGDEVFMTGLFSFVDRTKRNMPITRTGNIAMFPEEALGIDAGDGTKFSDVYLIEARSIGGASGSPVFARKTYAVQIDQAEPPTIVTGYGREFYLLGMMHGHWDVREDTLNDHRAIVSPRGVNMGIAKVVPAHKILETLNNPELVFLREEMELRIG